MKTPFSTSPKSSVSNVWMVDTGIDGLAGFEREHRVAPSRNGMVFPMRIDEIAVFVLTADCFGPRLVSVSIEDIIKFAFFG